MFTDTYGNLYERNAQIFTNMFDNLEQYYSKGGVKLTESMEHFFEELYQRIFQVFNPSRSFSDSYLACATKHLSIIKPFEDVPEKLTKNIKNALVAARTFEQALNGGIDFIKGIISVSNHHREDSRGELSKFKCGDLFFSAGTIGDWCCRCMSIGCLLILFCPQAGRENFSFLFLLLRFLSLFSLYNQ